MTNHSRITLTVMPDYGMGPFLWINRGGEDAGVGGNCCDATGPCGSHPLSAALHADFSKWVTEFGNAPFLSPESSASVHLNWAAFHKRGLGLARRLKFEMGEHYRVVYAKPMEDPNRTRNQRREVNEDGTLMLLSTRRSHPEAGA